MDTSSLLVDIRLRGSFPQADDLFSDNDLLRILDNEMLSQVVPLIVKINEEYFLTYKDYSITPGTESYRIPRRAIGSSLRDVQKISPSGDVSQMSRLFEENRTSLTNSVSGYFVKGNQILLSPIPVNAGDTLRMAYFRRPSKFVLPIECAQITVVDTLNNQLTVASVPTTFANGISLDLVEANTPYDILGLDQTLVSVTGNILTFASLPVDISVGDYVCLSSQSCLPMVPEEIIPLLCQAALCTCLSSKKDKSVDLEIQKLELLKQSLLSLLAPRIKSDEVKITNDNSVLNYFRFRW